MRLGIEKTAMIRVRAGISYALTEAMFVSAIVDFSCGGSAIRPHDAGGIEFQMRRRQDAAERGPRGHAANNLALASPFMRFS
jgi:hypothetical protein